jgi:hypothetical protein
MDRRQNMPKNVVFSSHVVDAGSRQLNEEGRIIRNTLIALTPSLRNIGCVALAEIDKETRSHKKRRIIHRTLFRIGCSGEEECLCVGVTIEDHADDRAVWVSYGEPHVGAIGSVANVVFSLDFLHPGTFYSDPAAEAKRWICCLLDEFGAEVLSRDSSSIALCGVMEEAAKRAECGTTA